MENNPNEKKSFDPVKDLIKHRLISIKEEIRIALAEKPKAEIFYTHIRKLQDYKKNFPEEIEYFSEIMDEISQIISKDFEYIIESSSFYYKPILIIALKELFNIDNSIWKKHQDYIIENLSGEDFLKYITYAKQQEGFDKQWSSYKLIKHIFRENPIINDETLCVMLSKFIDELCEHEGLKPTDVTFAGRGYNSLTMRVGNYVLKVGQTRKNNTILDDKRIIRPLVRMQTNAEKRLDIANTFVEIQNVVNANWYEGLSEDEIKEELYRVYKELRDRGIVWCDVKKENIGRLLKPNKENFMIDGEELKSSNYTVSFSGKRSEEVLPAGELVIIDTDYIIKEDEMSTTIALGYGEEFKERYKKEQNEKLAKDLSQLPNKNKPNFFEKIRKRREEEIR